jgi:hypothetical protein
LSEQHRLGYLVLLPLLSGCLKQQVSNWSPADATSARGAGAPLLSAFFGLDNGLLNKVGRLCPGAGGQDGMPLIFSYELDLDTLEAGDITVVTAAGERRPVGCVTMGPAIDEGELRTALLTGEFGGASDPPAAVEITGHLLSMDGAHDFHGAKIPVIPLAAGPTLVFAEAATPEQFGGRRPIGPARGTRCPAWTAQAIRVTWAGGITKPGGASADMVEGARYALTLADGSVVGPAALADLKDNDNNHLLCLEDTREVVSVSFPEGLVTDPNEDLNPATRIEVRRTE